MAKTTKTYKWGLFSDYGMKILNETFTTKREAQKAFREWGYTEPIYTKIDGWKIKGKSIDCYHMRSAAIKKGE